MFDFMKNINNLALRLCLLSLLSVLFTVTVHAQSIMERKKETPKDAQEIVEIIRSRVPVKKIESQGVLKVRAPKTKIRSVPVHFEVRPLSEDSWESVYEATMPEGGQERLLIRSYINLPNEYVLSKKSEKETEWKMNNIQPGEESAVSFAGTDFWFCDLGLEFLGWPDQLFFKREMRKGRPCRVIQSAPEVRTGMMYARVVSWVDNESDGIVMAQSYNEFNKRLKEFEVQSFKKVEGVWQLKKMTIYDNLTDSRTTLEIDLEVDEEN